MDQATLTQQQIWQIQQQLAGLPQMHQRQQLEPQYWLSPQAQIQQQQQHGMQQQAYQTLFAASQKHQMPAQQHHQGQPPSLTTLAENLVQLRQRQVQEAQTQEQIQQLIYQVPSKTMRQYHRNIKPLLEQILKQQEQLSCEFRELQQCISPPAPRESGTSEE